MNKIKKIEIQKKVIFENNINKKRKNKNKLKYNMIQVLKPKVAKVVMKKSNKMYLNQNLKRQKVIQRKN